MEVQTEERSNHTTHLYKKQEEKNKKQKKHSCKLEPGHLAHTFLLELHERRKENLLCTNGIHVSLAKTPEMHTVANFFPLIINTGHKSNRIYRAVNLMATPLSRSPVIPHPLSVFQ